MNYIILLSVFIWFSTLYCLTSLISSLIKNYKKNKDSNLKFRNGGVGIIRDNYGPFISNRDAFLQKFKTFKKDSIPKERYFHVSYVFNSPNGTHFGSCQVSTITISPMKVSEELMKLLQSEGRNPSSNPTIISIFELEESNFKECLKMVN